MFENEHPLWVGSVRPVVFGSVVWEQRRNGELYRVVVEERRPLVLIGRNSGSSGRAGAREAAKDLHAAALGLRLRCGLDVSALLPEVDELVEMLMASANVVKSVDPDGREFKNRFCLLDFPAHGLIVSLSTGSAYKVDSELNQPHVRWLQRLIRELKPAGFFASKFNRVSRVLWQTGLLVEELKGLQSRRGSAWACDDQYGEWNLGDEAALIHAIRGQQASTEATEFRRNGTSAQVRLAGKQMVDGLVQYSLATGIPAGLFAYRCRRSGRMFLGVDSPGFYPDSEDVQYGLPNVRHSDGELVDQAENIRWFLAEFARPGVSLTAAVRGLVARRYSTQWLRSIKNVGSPSAFYGSEKWPLRSDSGFSLGRSIIRNLSLYETGVLERTVGPDEDQRIVVTDVFPDVGSWAEPAVFAAIRVKLADEARRSEASRSWSWSGMPVVVDGVRGELRPRQVNASEDVSWVLYTGSSVASRGDDGSGGSGGAVEPEDGLRVPAIPDRLLVGSIVKALVAADGRPLTPHLSAVRVDDGTVAATFALTQAQADLAVQETALEHCLEAVVSGQVQGDMLAGLQKKYDGLAVKVESAREDVQSAQRRLDGLVAARVGVDASAMSALVAGLRNPATNAYRADLRRAVSGLSVTCTPLLFGNFKGVRLDATGLLLFDVDDVAYELPFSFSRQMGRSFEIDEDARWLIHDLRRGIPRRLARDNEARGIAGRAVDLLGSRSGYALSACEDPMLLRLGMAAVFPNPVEGLFGDPSGGEDPAEITSVDDLVADEAFVADFGDVAELARRVSSLYASYEGHKWVRGHRGKTEVEALLRMARGEVSVPVTGYRERTKVQSLQASLRNQGRRGRWTFSDGLWPVLSPCGFCGSTTAGAMRLAEVTGYLCLESACRKDEAGVSWPTRFDQYISGPKAYLDSGVTLVLPPEFNPVSAVPIPCADATLTAEPSGRAGQPDETAPLVGSSGSQGEAGLAAGASGRPTRSKARKWNSLQDLDEAARAAIIEAYEDSSRLVKDIQTAFRVNPKTLYDIVTAAGVAQRRPGRARRTQPSPTQPSQPSSGLRTA